MVHELKWPLTTMVKMKMFIKIRTVNESSTNCQDTSSSFKAKILRYWTVATECVRYLRRISQCFTVKPGYADNVECTNGNCAVVVGNNRECVRWPYYEI